MFALPGQDDGLSTLGFQSRPDMDRVLASTSFLVDTATGALIESVVLRLAAAAETLLESHTEVARLIASGGVFAWHPELAQVIADAIGRPVALAEDAERS